MKPNTNNNYNMMLSIKDMNNVIGMNIETFEDIEKIYKTNASKRSQKQVDRPENITKGAEILFRSIKESYLQNTTYDDFVPWFIQHLKDAISHLLKSETKHYKRDTNYIYLPYCPTGEECDFIFTRYEIFGILSCCLFGIDLLTPNHVNKTSITLRRILTQQHGLQKTICILGYLFVMCVYPEKEEEVVYSRKILSQKVDWEESTQLLQDIDYGMNGIEVSDHEIQVDFANKIIHLGNISTSATQEEILFAVKPECYLSIVLFDTMASNECILIEHCLTINKTDGFRNSFRWKMIHDEKMITKETSVLAIDSCTASCFSPNNIHRDMNKCYLGFLCGKAPVASGQWGCGAFQNDPTLKFFQQVCVASEVNVRLKLHWMNENEYLKLYNLLKQMLKKKMTVGDLMTIILKNTKQTKFFEYLQDEVNKFKF